MEKVLRFRVYHLRQYAEKSPAPMQLADKTEHKDLVVDKNGHFPRRTTKNRHWLHD
jgi:hypothetical protein